MFSPQTGTKKLLAIAMAVVIAIMSLGIQLALPAFAEGEDVENTVAEAADSVEDSAVGDNAPAREAAPPEDDPAEENNNMEASGNPEEVTDPNGMEQPKEPHEEEQTEQQDKEEAPGTEIRTQNENGEEIAAEVMEETPMMAVALVAPLANIPEEPQMGLLEYKLHFEGGGSTATVPTGTVQTVKMEVNYSDVGHETVPTVDLENVFVEMKIYAPKDKITYDLSDYDGNKIELDFGSGKATELEYVPGDGGSLETGYYTFTVKSKQAIAAGSSGNLKLFFNIAHKNGVTQDGAEIRIESTIGMLDSQDGRVSDDKLPVLPPEEDEHAINKTLTLTGTAECVPYTIDSFAVPVVAPVNGSAVDSFEMQFDVKYDKNLNDKGTIYPRTITLDKTITLTGGANFNKLGGGQVMLGSLNLLGMNAGDTATVKCTQDKEWDLEIIATSDAELKLRLTYSEGESSTAPAIKDTSFLLQFANLSHSGGLTADSKVTGAAEIATKDWFGTDVIPKDDTNCEVLLIDPNDIGKYSETGRESEKIKKYATRYGQGTDETDLNKTTLASDTVAYNPDSDTLVEFRYGDFGNYNRNVMSSLTLTEYADKTYGYDPSWLVPVKVYTGKLYQEGGAPHAGKVTLKIITQSGYKDVTITNIAQGVWVDLTELTIDPISRMELVYSDLQPGTKASADKLEMPGMLFRVIEHPEANDTVPNRVQLGYKVDIVQIVDGQSSNVPYECKATDKKQPYATASFKYAGTTNATVGYNKGVRAIKTEGSGYYGGDLLEYTIIVTNTGVLPVNNISITDTMTQANVAEGPRPAAAFITKEEKNLAAYVNQLVFSQKESGIVFTPGSKLLTQSELVSRGNDNTPGFQEVTTTAVDTTSWVMTFNASSLNVSGSNAITLNPGETLVIKYVVQLAEDAVAGEEVINNFEVTSKVGPGGGEGPGGEWKNDCTIVISGLKPEIHVNKYVDPAKKSQSSLTVKLSDLLDTGTPEEAIEPSLTYYLEGTFAGMSTPSQNSSVYTLYLLEEIPQQLRGLAYEGSYQVNGSDNLSGYTVSATPSAGLTTDGSNAPNPTPSAPEDANYILFALSKTDGSALDAGTVFTAKLTFQDIDTNSDRFIAGGSMKNNVYVGAATDNAGLEMINDFLYKLTGTTGITRESDAFGTGLDGVRNTFTHHFAEADKEKLGIEKILHSTAAVKLPGDTTLTYRVNVKNEGMQVGGDGHKAVFYDLLPLGQTYTANTLYYLRKYSGSTSTYWYRITDCETSFVTVNGEERQLLKFSLAIPAGSEMQIEYKARINQYDDALLKGQKSIDYDNEVIILDPLRNKEIYAITADTYMGTRFSGSGAGEGTPTTVNGAYVAANMAGDVDLFEEANAFYAKAPVTYTAEKIKPGITKTMKSKTTGLGNVEHGTKILWEIVANNNSRVAMKDYVISDVLPEGLGFDSMAPDSAITAEPVQEALPDGGTMLYWIGGPELKTGATTSVKIRFYAVPLEGYESSHFRNYAYVVPSQEFDTTDKGTKSAMTTDPFTQGFNLGYLGGYDPAVRAEADVFYYRYNTVLSYKQVTNHNNETANALEYVPTQIDKEVTYTLMLINPDETKPHLSIMDILPMRGDKGVKTSQNRYSKFALADITNVAVYKDKNITASRTEPPKPGSSTLVAPSNYTLYLSDKGMDVKGGWNPGYAAADWQQTNALSGSNALLIVFNDDFELKTGERLYVQYKASVQTIGAEDGAIAWNSFAYRYVMEESGETITEPPKVGVIISKPTHKLVLTKELAAREQEDARFFFKVTSEANPEEFTIVPVVVEAGKLSAGESLPGLEAGAYRVEEVFEGPDGNYYSIGSPEANDFAYTCVLRSDSAGAEHKGDYIKATFSPANADDIITIRVTAKNTRIPVTASLRIVKDVEGVGSNTTRTFYFKLFKRNESGRYEPYGDDAAFDLVVTGANRDEITFEVEPGEYRVREYPSSSVRNRDDNASRGGAPAGFDVSYSYSGSSGSSISLQAGNRGSIYVTNTRIRTTDPDDPDDPGTPTNPGEPGNPNTPGGTRDPRDPDDPNTRPFFPIGDLPIPLTGLPGLSTIFDDGIPLGSLPFAGGIGRALSQGGNGAAVISGLVAITAAAGVLIGGRKKKRRSEDGEESV